jgi:glycosyltransferase involved in cell wall biosynthesis
LESAPVRPLPLPNARRNTADVSVVIPTFNRRDYVLGAVNSALGQTTPPREIIVVDDASTDDTEPALTSYIETDSVRYIRLPRNVGPGGARNAGVQAARCQYVAVLDSDDLWLPNKLERQVSILDSRPDIGLVYGNCLNWDPSKDRQWIRVCNALPEGDVYRLAIFRRLFVSWITVLVRRTCFDDAGLFDESLRRHEDRDLTIRMTRRYRVAAIQDPVAIVRLHSASTPKDPKDTLPYGEWVRQEKYVIDKVLAEHADDALLLRRLRARYAYVWGSGYIERGARPEALRWLTRSILTWPFDPRPYVRLPLAFLRGRATELPGG